MRTEVEYWSTEKGARELAKQIQEYWQKRGFIISTHLEKISYNRGKERERSLYGVRSNLNDIMRSFNEI